MAGIITTKGRRHEGFFVLSSLRGYYRFHGAEQARDSITSGGGGDRASASVWAEFHDRSEPGEAGGGCGIDRGGGTGHRGWAGDGDAYGRIISARGGFAGGGDRSRSGGGASGKVCGECAVCAH